MQKITITYICDNCSEVLSDPDKKINKKHLSLNFQGKNQGWVSVRNGKKRGDWKFLSTLPVDTAHENQIQTICQFCDYKCFAKFFDKLVIKNQINKLKE